VKGLKQIPHLDAGSARQIFSDRVQRRSSIKTRGFDDQLSLPVEIIDLHRPSLPAYMGQFLTM
jgi:hypothetical protein